MKARNLPGTIAVLFGSALAQGEAQAIIDAGAAIYATNCLSCHQATGEGIDGAFPALAGNAFVTGEVQPVADVVVNGQGGMPSFGGQLSDDELAGVLSYIRNAWGNEASVLTPEEVAALRTGAADEAPSDPNARPGAD